MVNRESNVFPGILGRVCDRPCEPACRRGRIESKPVAICRLKRVAADNRDDVTALLPRAPDQKNGKRVACIGAGPASLTVANDLLPLGYEVTIFEQFAVPGGLMRTNIPAFRLPASVLDEEIGYIVDMGADLKLGTPVESMRALLDSEEFDAVFVGTGAPKGKELELPGRHDSDRVHIGIAWLESVAFQHIDKIGERVLIIGVGNTAMDCCRTSLRLGAKDVKVMARKPRQFFKASDWELEDAEQENVQIVVNRAPKSFVVENGLLEGMLFEHLEYEIEDGDITVDPRARGGVLPVRRCDSRDRPGERLSLDRARRRHRVRQMERAARSTRTTFQSTREGVFFGGDAAFGPKNIIWSVEHGHQAAISIHKYCCGEPVTERMPRGVTLEQPQDGHARVVLQERVQRRRAAPGPARRADRAVQEDQRRGRTRIHRRTGRARGAALPQLRRADRVRGEALHRMRCVHRHLSRRLPHHRAERHGGASCARASRRRRPIPSRRCMYRVRCRRPGASWSRTRTCACIAACAPSAVLPPPGTCRNPRSRFLIAEDESATCRTYVNAPRPGERLRGQVRERQRHGIGERELADHEGHIPHGRSGHRQELLSLEHPGAAYLVRDSRDARRLRRARRPRRHHGGDERGDLFEGRARGRLRRLSASTTQPGRAARSCSAATSRSSACRSRSS